VALSTGLAAADGGVTITLKHGTPTEAATRDQLRRLMNTYDLSPWFFTSSIVVDDSAIPHSHPVLTLHTRHLKDDDLFLSTFVHEELHWFLVQRGEERDGAIKELRTLFPSVPARAPEGANGEESTYLHLLDCYLEWQADKALFGELRARQVMEFWATDHYTWVYRTVLDKPDVIRRVVANFKLVPGRPQ